MRRAAIYARQSITREGSESLPAQVEACRSTAKRLKVNVVAELIEAPSTSGYRNRGRNRPKFQELLDLIRNGEVDCVIAYKTDRLSRGGGPGWAPLVDAFEAAGRDPDHVIATTDGWVSEFEIGIRSAMDREESKKTSQRMLDVRRREANSGAPRITGRRAFGYTNDYSAIVDEEAALIREAVNRVLSGESMWSIVSDWDERGVPTVTGSGWRTAPDSTSCTAASRRATRSPRFHAHAAIPHKNTEPLPSSSSRNDTPSATHEDPPGAKGNGGIAPNVLATNTIDPTSRRSSFLRIDYLTPQMPLGGYLLLTGGVGDAMSGGLDSSTSTQTA